MAFGVAMGIGMMGSGIAVAQTAGNSWPQFRGPAGNAVTEGTIPTTWDESDYVWSKPLDTRDVGSPVTYGSKVFYMRSSPTGGAISLECCDVSSGQTLWSRSFPQSTYVTHARNTFASSTPAVDSEFVFAAWSDPEHTWLIAMDHEGNNVWSRDFGRWQSQHGFGTSPRIVDSMVVLMDSQQALELEAGETAGVSRLIAVDRSTGRSLWETPLNTQRSCYGVPAVLRDADGKAVQLIGANSGDGLFGVDPDTGKMLWSFKAFEQRVCSSPLIIGNLALGTCGSGGGGNEVVAVRIPTDGGQPREVYRITSNAPYVPTPVIKNGLLFAVSDNGIATCHNAFTGQAVWRPQRLGGNFGASPIIVGDRIFAINTDGKAFILAASEDFEKLGEVDLGGAVEATPAYANGKLFIRIAERLVCLDCNKIANQ